MLVTGLCVLWNKYKKSIFFLLWYIVFYLPVSNLIPIVNPIACRYMYLPSIGVLIALAFFLHKAFKSNILKKYSKYFSGYASRSCNYDLYYTNIVFKRRLEK